MSDNIMLMIGDDGEATLYDDTYDITIHCESKEEHDEAMRLLKNVPPERKKGKWIPDNNNYYEERFICSVCGRSYKVDTCMGKPMWDFCPCGADMREVAE